MIGSGRFSFDCELRCQSEKTEELLVTPLMETPEIDTDNSVCDGEQSSCTTQQCKYWVTSRRVSITTCARILRLLD